MYSLIETKEMMVEIGRKLYEKEYIVASEGNLSTRLDQWRILTTPAGMCKGQLRADDLVITDLEGKRVEGKNKPSSELLMHLVVYRERPNVFGVVHAHPRTCTGFAVAGIPLDPALMAEVVVTLGCVPLAEYGTPSTEELADAVGKYIREYDALLLSNHGAITVGKDLLSAYYKMETLEHYAQINLIARTLGRVQPISTENVEKLVALREKYGVEGPSVQCPVSHGGSCPAGGPETVTMTRSQLAGLIEDAVRTITG